MPVHDHPALKNVSKEWPHFLGYNKTLPIVGHDVVVTIEGDPFLRSVISAKARPVYSHLTAHRPGARRSL